MTTITSSTKEQLLSGGEHSIPKIYVGAKRPSLRLATADGDAVSQGAERSQQGSTSVSISNEARAKLEAEREGWVDAPDLARKLGVGRVHGPQSAISVWRNALLDD